MSNFLRYIVTETINGNGSRIKAYTVGVDALGKPDDFDAQADPSVRVLALRLRKNLAAAYEDDKPCHARIVLRVGSYVPEFYKPEAFLDTSPTAPHRLESSLANNNSGMGYEVASTETREAVNGVNHSLAGSQRVSNLRNIHLPGGSQHIGVEEVPSNPRFDDHNRQLVAGAGQGKLTR